MNKDQRKQLGKLQDQLNLISDNLAELLTKSDDPDQETDVQDMWEQATSTCLPIEGIASDIDEIKGDEEGKLDNMTDSLRDGEKGQVMQESIEYLQEAYDQLEAVDSVMSNKVDDREALLANIEALIDAVDSAIEEIDNATNN